MLHLGFHHLFLSPKKQSRNKKDTLYHISRKLSLTLILSISLAIRWYISEHIPLSNTYETLQVIALTSLILACFMHNQATAALIVIAGCPY